jgi:hypothetical protein
MVIMVLEATNQQYRPMWGLKPPCNNRSHFQQAGQSLFLGHVGGPSAMATDHLPAVATMVFQGPEGPVGTSLPALMQAGLFVVAKLNEHEKEEAALAFALQQYSLLGGSQQAVTLRNTSSPISHSLTEGHLLSS